MLSHEERQRFVKWNFWEKGERREKVSLVSWVSSTKWSSFHGTPKKLELCRSVSWVWVLFYSCVSLFGALRCLSLHPFFIAIVLKKKRKLLSFYRLNDIIFNLCTVCEQGKEFLCTKKYWNIACIFVPRWKNIVLIVGQVVIQHDKIPKENRIENVICLPNFFVSLGV